MDARLHDLEAPVAARLEALDQDAFVARLWARDATLWPGDPEAIRRRLGWLEAPTRARTALPEWQAVAGALRAGRWRGSAVLGMGGSSLFPEVLSTVFGPGDGGLPLSILDTTDPAAVSAFEETRPPAETLFVVASKSGTTLETLSLYRYFEAKGGSFVAITDPGTPLEATAAETGFEGCIHGTEDVGGRYSAMTAFGLFPALLLDLEAERLVSEAEGMAEACRQAPAQNPGVVLGVVLGEAVRAGRDKLTLLLSKEIGAFAHWVEQLVAESTGKDGRGVVPVVEEREAMRTGPLDDRLFVHLALEGEPDLLAPYASSGHPCLRIELPSSRQIGAEVFRWEVATATCAHILSVDPFDEPDVALSKRLTSEILQAWGEGRFESPPARAELGGRPVHADPHLPETDDPLSAHLGRATPGDYLALLAYLPRTGAIDGRLARLREALAARMGIATTLGYGPRFQHSTGQLHKGGPNTGLFLQFVWEAGPELPIPGVGYDFATLEAAQAWGDFRALVERGRRILRIDLGPDPVAGLDRLLARL